MACKTPGGGNYHTKRSEVVVVPLRVSKKRVWYLLGRSASGAPSGSFSGTFKTRPQSRILVPLRGPYQNIRRAPPSLSIWESSVRMGAGGGGRGKQENRVIWIDNPTTFTSICEKPPRYFFSLTSQNIVKKLSLTACQFRK